VALAESIMHNVRRRSRTKELVFGPKKRHKRHALAATGVTCDACFGRPSGSAMQSFGSLIFTSGDASFFEGLIYRHADELSIAACAAYYEYFMDAELGLPRGAA